MSSGSYRQVYVKCPFYKKDDGKRSITCEGLVDRSSILLQYILKKDFEMQMDVFCCQHFEKCEVYRVLMEKYED